MKWIEIKGDIAEQMMRYAYVLYLKNCGEDVGVAIGGKWIGDIFPNVPRCEMRKISVCEKIKSHIIKTDVEDEDNWMNYNNVDSLGAVVAKYFELREDSIPNIYDNIKISLKKDESVAIHVLSPTSKISTCTPDYYNWAIAGIRTWINRPHFVIVTDDVKWCKRNLLNLEDDTEYFAVPTRQHDRIFETLKYAKHNVICNRLSSWWGAWLNDNPDKIVVAPKVWSYNAEYKKLIPLYWTIMPTT